MKKNGSGAWRIWIFCAVLVALSIVLTRFASINIGQTVRIGLGRLPIMLAGIWYGPFAGLAVGAAADFLGAIMSTGWNPVLTVPAALCGLLPFLFMKLFRVGKGGLGEKNSLKMIPGISFTVLLTKVIAQGLLMTLLLAIMYSGFESFGPLLLTRNAITVGEGIVEAALIFVLYTNKAVWKASGAGNVHLE